MEHAIDNHRELAEAHFKLALAFEHSEQFEMAIEQIQLAMDCLTKRVNELQDVDVVEKGELNGFLTELEAKLVDIESLIEKEDQGEKISTKEQLQSPLVVNDISNLVKKSVANSPKKRKQKEGEQAEKKIKIE
jgi:hypothetical protein